ncbi:unnamed protein product [Merluccius merluccius]
MRYALELYGRHFSKLACYRNPEVRQECCRQQAEAFTVVGKCPELVELVWCSWLVDLVEELRQMPHMKTPGMLQ